MQIVDTHCHLDSVDLPAFGGSMESLLAHAKTLSVIDLKYSKNQTNIPNTIKPAQNFKKCKQTQKT